MEPRPRRRLLSRPRQIAGESRTWFGEGLPIRRVFPDAAMRCLAVPVPADQSMTRMRYALTINVAAWPPDIARLWREVLRPHGMLAELPAGFRQKAVELTVKGVCADCGPTQNKARTSGRHQH